MKNCGYTFFLLLALCSFKRAHAQLTGIGTSPPLVQLHIGNNSDSVALIENILSLGSGINNGLFFKTGNGSNPYTGAVITTGQSSNTARLGFFTGASAAPGGLSERLSILHNGNVGINNLQPDSLFTLTGAASINGNLLIGNSPAVKLEVNGSLKTTNFQLTTNAGNGKILRSDTAGNAKWSGCGLAIGQSFGGGIIFYLDASGCHGLVAAPYNQGGILRWDNGGFVNTNAYDEGISAGAGNTKLILYNQGVGTINYAAKLCDELTIGIYDDWYLPSKYELNLMYYNIGFGAAPPNTNIGGFPESYYWSSSEYDKDNAWYQIFVSGLGIQNYALKYTDLSVRAIRAF